MSRIPTPKMSEFLEEEFLKPLNLSTDDLANQTRVPAVQVQDISHDRRKVTAEISVKLGRVFGVSNQYFLNLQSDIDLRNAKEYDGRN